MFGEGEAKVSWHRSSRHAMTEGAKKKNGAYLQDSVLIYSMLGALVLCIHSFSWVVKDFVNSMLVVCLMAFMRQLSGAVPRFVPEKPIITDTQ